MKIDESISGAKYVWFSDPLKEAQCSYHAEKVQETAKFAG